MIKDEARLSIRINRGVHQKLAYISDYYGRSINRQIDWLIKQEIARFEKENGPITAEDLKKNQ